MLIEFKPHQKTIAHFREWEAWLNEHVDEWSWVRDSFLINETSKIEYLSGINLDEEDAIAFKITFGL